MKLLTWFGIIFCITQSAMFSGLNLAFFTISKLKLEIESKKGNKEAKKVLALRHDSNFLLAAILWGNVSVNVLLALLSDSVLAGVFAFMFSTVVITIFGEIMPQAYFSRNALKYASLLSPVIRFYQFLLFPFAKLTAVVLDRWIGPESITYFEEKDIRELIKLHMKSYKTDIENVEGQGALNFLEIDDIPLTEEGEIVDPKSIIQMNFSGGRPVFPEIKPDISDVFLKKIHESGKKWIVITDEKNEPVIILNSNEFIRDAIFNGGNFRPYWHCFRPVIVRDIHATVGNVITFFNVEPEHSSDDVVEYDVIVYWGNEKRIITGSDILGRLLRGIARNPAVDKGRE